MPKQQFACDWCGKEFLRWAAHVTGKVYCSRECYGFGKRNGEHRACLHCGKTFYAKGSEIARRGGVYCSHLCFLKSGRAECVCKQCGISFICDQSRIRRGGGKYCSAPCAAAAHSARYSVTVPCVVCGTLKKFPRGQIERGGKYCSVKCRSQMIKGFTQGGVLFCTHGKACRRPQYQDELCKKHYERRQLLSLTKEHPAPEYAFQWKFTDRRPYGSGTAPRAMHDWRQRYKRDVMAYYCKGKPQCMQCGFDDLRALCIDHIANNGAEHRQSLTGQTGRRAAMGSTIYLWLKRQNYPDGFQVLCANCNMIKETEYREANPGKRTRKRRQTVTHDSGSAFQ